MAVFQHFVGQNKGREVVFIYLFAGDELQTGNEFLHVLDTMKVLPLNRGIAAV